MYVCIRTHIYTYIYICVCVWDILMDHKLHMVMCQNCARMPPNFIFAEEGATTVLVSTNALEEGIDVADCTWVFWLLVGAFFSL